MVSYKVEYHNATNTDFHGKKKATHGVGSFSFHLAVGNVWADEDFSNVSLSPVNIL